MPTYRISNRHTGAILVPPVQTDSEISAGLEYLSTLPEILPSLELSDLIISQLSANPPVSIFTVAVNLSEGQGGGVKELLTTGSRSTAAREAAKTPGAFVIEEDREQNLQRSKERKG